MKSLIAILAVFLAACGSGLDLGDGGRCTPGESFCVGTEFWTCNLDGTDASLQILCSGNLRGSAIGAALVCQMPDQNAACKSDGGPCCCEANSTQCVTNLLDLSSF